MVLFSVNPISALDPGKDSMEFVIEGETCARMMPTVERLETSAVLMAVRKTVLNSVSLPLLFIYC